MASKPLLHLITLADENAKSCSEFQAGGSDWEAGSQMDTLPRRAWGGAGPADPWGDGERVHRAQALAQTGLRLHRAGMMWEPERRPTLMTQG